MEHERPPVAVREQALLVVIELLARLSRVLEARALGDASRREREKLELDAPYKYAATRR
jgi:hypothetical protein